MKALFLADLCPTEITNELFRKQDVSTLFGDARTLFDHQDFICLNLECALTESDGAIEKFGPNLRACTETADVMKTLRVSLCGISNNHVFDYGKQGARDTLAALARVGIPYTGFGENLADSRKNFYFEKDGETLAVVAVCEHEYSYALENRMGSRPFDEFETIEDIREAKQKADRVVVLYHGAKEHCQYPSPRIRRVCRAMIRAGADLVTCQHTHCICGHEEYMGGHILYGQGNFHFVKENATDMWRQALAIAYDTATGNVNFVPIVANESGIELAKGAEREQMLAMLSDLSASLLDGRWREGWHAFCLEVGPKYLKRLREAGGDDLSERPNLVFGHYLDCEAHTDVYRELFPTANLRNELD